MQSISTLASGVSKAVWGDNTTQRADTEPVAGETGKGTAAEPYDAGNAPEQEAPSTTAVAPAEKKTPSPERPGNNARAPSFALKETATGSAAHPNSASVKDDQVAAAGKPLDEPASTDLVKDERNPNEVVANSNKNKNAAYDADSPFDAATTSPSDSPEKSRSYSAERSVSPGARPDGTHAATGKPEKSKLSSRIKEKLHIGSSKH